MITKRPLSYWVKTSNMKLQVILLALILITVAARVFPLEVPVTMTTFLPERAYFQASIWWL